MRDRETLTEVNQFVTLSLILGLLTSWFITHPYLGIQHDALLYAVQALSYLHPDAYQNDIFIRFGFQGDYTIFSRLYSCAISVLGFSNATITLMLIGHALWLSASFLLARTLLTGKSIWLFLGLLFTLPRYYGSESVFSYGESFLTPRIYSEALIIYSIAFLIRERALLASIFVFTSLLFNPLMAGCGLIFLLLHGHKRNFTKGVFRLLLATGTVLILAGIGVVPFDSLFHVMDQYWYDLAYLRNSFVFLGTWAIEEINLVIFNCSIILSAMIIANEQQRTVLLYVLVIGVSSLVVSWIGADIIHNVFVIKVQLWRALWLTHWFSHLAMALLIGSWKNSSHASRILLLCYFTAWFSLEHVGGILSVIVLLLFFLSHRLTKHPFISKAVRNLSYLPPVTSGILWLLAKAYEVNQDLAVGNDFSASVFIIVFLLKTKILFTFAFFLFWKLLISVESKVQAKVMFLFILFIFTTLMGCWDVRPPWKRLMENDRFLSGVPFKDKIPANAVVYWEDSIEKTWLILGRSCYASDRQGSAVLFSCTLASIWEKRTKRLEALGVKDSIISHKNWARMKDAPGTPTLDGLVHVCHDPVLDFVILSSEFSACLLEKSYDKQKEVFYYLYDCQCIRERYQDRLESIKDGKRGQ